MAADSWRVLGSGTLEFIPGRNPSAHLLTVGSRRILVDSGPGTIAALAALGLTTRDLDAVVHSHMHLDHLGDLFALWFHLRITAARDRPPLLVAGAPGHQDRLMAAADAIDPKLALAPVTWEEQAPDGRTQALGDLGVQVRAWPAAHSQHPRLLRFSTPDWSVTYSGDTGPTPALAEAARGVDWLVVECTSPDHARRRGHLAPSDVADVVATARPRGVALVHLSPEWTCPDDAARAVRLALEDRWEGTIVASRDGTELPLPYSHSMVPGGFDEMS